MNFTQAQYSFGEGSGNVQVELMFSNPSLFDIVVYVMSNNITATGVNSSECLESDGTDDYMYGVYSVTFPANVTLQLVDITICDDSVLEEDETFSLTIVSNSIPDNVTNGSPDSVTVTIVDNDRKCLLLPLSLFNEHQFVQGPVVRYKKAFKTLPPLKLRKVSGVQETILRTAIIIIITYI